MMFISCLNTFGKPVFFIDKTIWKYHLVWSDVIAVFLLTVYNISYLLLCLEWHPSFNQSLMLYRWIEKRQAILIPKAKRNLVSSTGFNSILMKWQYNRMWECMSIHVAKYGFDGSWNQGSVCGSDILSQRQKIYLSSKMAGQNFVVFNSMIFFVVKCS